MISIVFETNYQYLKEEKEEKMLAAKKKKSSTKRRKEHRQLGRSTSPLETSQS